MTENSMRDAPTDNSLGGAATDVYVPESSSSVGPWASHGIHGLSHSKLLRHRHREHRCLSAYCGDPEGRETMRPGV